MIPEVRSPEGLREAMTLLIAGVESWSGPVGVAVLGRVEVMARAALARTPVVVSDPHLVSSTVSHVWERLLAGGARGVVAAEHPAGVLRAIVRRTMVQVARASALGVADPSATRRATATGEAPVRLGDRTDVVEGDDWSPGEHRVTTVGELLGGIEVAVQTTCLRAGKSFEEASAAAVKAADALQYVIDDVAAHGIADAYRRLCNDPRLDELLSWWSARALVMTVTGVSSGQPSWASARTSVLAKLYVARACGDEREIADIAPEWGKVLARVTASFRVDLTPPPYRPAMSFAPAAVVQSSLFEVVAL